MLSFKVTYFLCTVYSDTTIQKDAWRKMPCMYVQQEMSAQIWWKEKYLRNNNPLRAVKKYRCAEVTLSKGSTREQERKEKGFNYVMSVQHSSTRRKRNVLKCWWLTFHRSRRRGVFVGVRKWVESLRTADWSERFALVRLWRTPWSPPLFATCARSRRCRCTSSDPPAQPPAGVFWWRQRAW